MPYLNIPLWHEDYFELKAIEDKETQEKLSSLPHLPQRKAGFPFDRVVPLSLEQEREHQLLSLMMEMALR